jgi:hypothetical protein
VPEAWQHPLLSDIHSVSRVEWVRLKIKFDRHQWNTRLGDYHEHQSRQTAIECVLFLVYLSQPQIRERSGRFSNMSGVSIHVFASHLIHRKFPWHLSSFKCCNWAVYKDHGFILALK